MRCVSRDRVGGIGYTVTSTSVLWTQKGPEVVRNSCKSQFVRGW